VRLVVSQFARCSVQNRERILVIFQDIPDVLTDGETGRKMLSTDPYASEDIQMRLDKLYRTLFEAIPKFIKLLGQYANSLPVPVPSYCACRRCKTCLANRRL
jgi:hypothetical protein